MLLENLGRLLKRVIIMKAKTIIYISLISVFILLSVNSAFSVSIFTVAGTVTNVDESLAKTGLEILVNNETRNLTSSDTLGKQEVGKYGIVFIDTDNKSIADIGDVLKITVKDTKQVSIIVTYKLTADDIANARAIVDIKLPSAKPSVFTVAGTVRNADGTLATSGLEVNVVNETKNLSAKDILGKQEAGKYGVVFIDTNNKIVADEGDVLKITVKNANQILADLSYKLTVNDITNSVANVDIKLGQVTPINQSPIASFSFSPNNPAINTEITFDASSSYDPDGQIASYEWDFGDGSKGKDKIVKHSYASDKQYSVSLKIADNEGKSNTTSVQVTVGKTTETPDSTDLLIKTIKQQEKKSIAVNIGGKQYLIVTLKNYINPKTLELSPSSNEVKIYTDTNRNPISDFEIVRKINVIDFAQQESNKINLKNNIDTLNKLKIAYPALDCVDMSIAAYEILTATASDVKELVNWFGAINTSTEALTAIQQLKELNKTKLTPLITLLITEIMKKLIWDPSSYAKSEISDKINLAINNYELAQKIKDKGNIENYEDANNFLNYYQYGKVYEDEALLLLKEIFGNYSNILIKFEPISGILTWGLSSFPKLIWEAKNVTNWEYVIDIEWIGKIGYEFYTRYYWFQLPEPATYTLKLSQRSDTLSNHTEFQKKYKEYMSFMDEVNKRQESLMSYFNSPGKEFLNSLGNEFLTWKNKLSSWTGSLKEMLSKVTNKISNIIGSLLKSPVELRIYDSKGRITGIVNGEIREEIPDSMYDKENEVALIFNATDIYRYEVIGTGDGFYGLEIASAKDGNASTFEANYVPIKPKSVNQFNIDWSNLSINEGVTINIDSDGNGDFEKTVNTGASYTIYPWDVNYDGVVDIQDLSIVIKHFGESPPSDPKVDVNKDGRVNILDLVLISQHFGEKYK
jgi:predicted secreted protein